MRIPVDPDSLGESFLHRLDHLVEGEPALEVLLGRVPDLGVDDAVGGEVLGALASDANQRVRGLHHADRVRERLEVQHQVLAIGSPRHPRAELADVARREALVAGLLGELHDGRRPQSPVEVVVQQDLGCFPDQLECGRAHDP